MRLGSYSTLGGYVQILAITLSLTHTPKPFPWTHRRHAARRRSPLRDERRELNQDDCEHCEKGCEGERYFWKPPVSVHVDRSLCYTYLTLSPIPIQTTAKFHSGNPAKTRSRMEEQYCCAISPIVWPEGGDPILHTFYPHCVAPAAAKGGSFVLT